MRYALISYAFLLVPIEYQHEQKKEIEFNTYPWEYTLALAIKEDKLIFLDAYANWCDPCKWVSRYVFNNDSVADYYNKTFFNISLDMEKDQGVVLAKKYHITEYPTFLYINGKGEIIFQHSGIEKSRKFYSKFIQFGRDAEVQKSKIDSERNGN